VPALEDVYLQLMGDSMTMARIRALLRKEFSILARNRTALLPVVLVTILTLVTAFGIAIVFRS